MKQLEYMLFVTEPNIRLCLHNGALEADRPDGTRLHVPLHNLQGIVTWSNDPATSPLLAACAEQGIGFTVMSRYGKSLYRICGKTSGNVEKRMKQYEIVNSEELRLKLAVAEITAKLYNSCEQLHRYAKNHGDESEIRSAMACLSNLIVRASKAHSTAELRGLEGTGAETYFSCFDAMIRANDERMKFEKRSRRPPQNPCNALLSLTYTTLANECALALESVGLDPAAGFFHGIRSGKQALALDLMEEFRASIADRFVLRLINLKEICSNMFEPAADGGWYLTKSGRKKFYTAWNDYRAREQWSEQAEQNIEIGLLPYVQAAKLARVIVGDDSEYIPYRG